MKKIILSAFIAISSVPGAEPASKVDSLPETTPHNPLSFCEGRLVFDVEERVRVESRENNFDFNSRVDSPTDDAWVLQRFRLGLRAKPSSWVSFYAQMQDAREWDSDRVNIPGKLGAEGDDTFDLRQGYVEVGDKKEFPLTLRLGRQALNYGDERLVGSSEWNNFARTFDAVKLRWEEKNWSLDGFASTVVAPTKGEFNKSDFLDGNETGRDQIFSGLYFSTTVVPVQTTDVYVFHLHENNGMTAAKSGNDTGFATLGMRVKSKPGVFAGTPAGKMPAGFEYEFEGAFQTGEVRGFDQTAFAVHGGLGYTFEAPWRPRIFSEYNFASGDDKALDGDSQTFQNLFPTNHKFYGAMDVFSWQNMHNAMLGMRVEPATNVTFQFEGHTFWLATNEDVWYRANGTTAVRPLNREADTYAGCETDVTLNWKATKNIALLAGHSHFFAGDCLKASGAADDADFFYLQAEVKY